jgi:hypothetical protein
MRRRRFFARTRGDDYERERHEGELIYPNLLLSLQPRSCRGVHGVADRPVQAGMTSRAFRFGYYAPMEDASLDIRRYIAVHPGPDAVQPQ